MKLAAMVVSCVAAIVSCVSAGFSIAVYTLDKIGK